jgi:predicted ATP-dependent serine protease
MLQNADQNGKAVNVTSARTLKPEDSEDRLSTGIEGLDDILNGGIPKGHLYLVEGDPGTGKTTLALQYLLEGARVGDKGIYVTLSESKLSWSRSRVLTAGILRRSASTRRFLRTRI